MSKTEAKKLQRGDIVIVKATGKQYTVDALEETTHGIAVRGYNFSGWFLHWHQEIRKKIEKKG